MNKLKLLSELGDRTADPFQAALCMKLIDAIDDNTPLGKLIINLLEYAEQGVFK